MAPAASRLLLVLLAVLLLTGVAFASFGCSKAEVPPSTSAPGSSTTVETADTGSNGGATEASGAFRLSSLDPGLLTGNFAQCPDCHSLLDQPGKVYPTLTASFKHGFHIEEGVQCDQCHMVPTHTEEGIRVPPMEKCFTCHSHEDASAPPGECITCHPEDFPLKPVSHDDANWLPATELRDSVSGLHTKTQVADAQDECGICHGPTFCESCHKVDMPHPANWTEEHPPQAREVGGSACRFCHPDAQACTTCHHTGYQAGGPPWVELHPSVVDSDGADKCIGCHSTKTCAHCHVTGEYRERE